MRNTSFRSALRIVQAGSFLILLAVSKPLFSAEVDYPDPAGRFTDYVANIVDSDRTNPPPGGAIVCIGSSSMRMWQQDIDRDLEPLTLIKRGFGGSNFADALHYVDQLVLAYQPRAVLVYEGDNDVGGTGVSPQKAFRTAEAFIDRIHERFPECRIYFISAKPSPSRWDKWLVLQELNSKLAAKCATDDRLFFLDVGPVMMDSDGMVDKSLFLEDMLHMNRAGYQRWKSVIRPVLIHNELEFEATP